MSHSLLSRSTLSCEFPKQKETSVTLFDPKLANLHPSMSEIGKTAAKLKSNIGWAPFLGELGLLTLLFKACNHIARCTLHKEVSRTLSIRRVGCTYSDVPVQRVPGAIHSQPHSLSLIMD
jgi:hypothetical protein